MRQRVLAIGIVIGLAVGAVRLAMAPTPIEGYLLLDDDNVAVKIIGSKVQWRGVTVNETAADVTIDLKEIAIRARALTMTSRTLRSD